MISVCGRSFWWIGSSINTVKMIILKSTNIFDLLRTFDSMVPGHVNLDKVLMMCRRGNPHSLKLSCSCQETLENIYCM